MLNMGGSKSAIPQASMGFPGQPVPLPDQKHSSPSLSKHESGVNMFAQPK